MQRDVVADTSPLNYLIAIDRLDCLAGLFGRIAIPTAVQVELRHPRSPRRVMEWNGSPPPWLVVHADPSELGEDLDALDEGEQHAIELAQQLSAGLLVDDRVAVAIARRRGIRVTGTLGVLLRAAARNLLDLPSAIDSLRATSFRCRPELFDEVLQRYREGFER